MSFSDPIVHYCSSWINRLMFPPNRDISPLQWDHLTKMSKGRRFANDERLYTSRCIWLSQGTHLAHNLPQQQQVAIIIHGLLCQHASFHPSLGQKRQKATTRWDHYICSHVRYLFVGGTSHEVYMSGLCQGTQPQV